MPEFNAVMARDLGYGIALPALAAFVIAFIATRLWRGGLKHMYLPANLAFAGGFFLGFALLHLEPWLPQDRDYGWLPYAAVIAGIAAAAARFTNVPYLRWSPAIFVALLAAWLIVPTWPRLAPVVWLWRIGVAATMAATWITLQLPSEQVGGPRLSFALAALSAAGAALLLLSGFAKFAQLALIGAAVIAGLAVYELFDRRLTVLPGIIPAFAVQHAGWLGCAWIRSMDEPPPKAAYVLMWLAPSMLGIAWLPWFRRRRWLGTIVPMMLAAALAAAAIILAA